MGDFPIIRARTEHPVSRRDISPEALNVLYRLKENNYTAYLVGGGVRDLLLGRVPKDFDISTNATPKEIRKIFHNCVLIGRRFRLAHILFGDRKIIETSTFRRQPQPKEPTDILQTDDNEFGSPQEDAFRRDFTINGLFYNIDDFTVIDYVGGLADLDARLIRSIGDPETRFREDPVRMLRAIRFASRLEFTIEESTWRAIELCKAEIHKASRPRLLEELYRLFKFGAGERAMRLLWQTGMLHEMMPEISAYLQKFPDPESAPWWKYLEIAAAQRLECEEEIITAMFFPLLAEKLKVPPSQMSCHDLQNALNEMAMPFCDRFGVPRRIRDLMRLIVITQYRFYARGKKRGNFSRSRFAAQAWFPAAFHLFAINAEIFPETPAESVQRWQNLLAEHSSDREAEKIAAAAKRNPNRRRRGGRRVRERREDEINREERASIEIGGDIEIAEISQLSFSSLDVEPLYNEGEV